ncbi:hypothetical protein ACJ41O_010021 [Fusarium nematophilum]
MRANLPPLEWREMYDIIDPFGDYRGVWISSIWFFDLDEEALTLYKAEGRCSTPLSLARQRQLTFDDFDPLPLPAPASNIDSILATTEWEPRLGYFPREKAFVGRVLGDFAQVWRHLLRRPQNDMTISKLAYAAICIASLTCSVDDRWGIDEGPGNTYVSIDDLPNWSSPEQPLIRTGDSWFVWTRDVSHGVDIIRQHIADEQPPSTCEKIFVVITLRHVVLCRARGFDLEWARPEVLFDGKEPPSDRAVDMLLWAAHRGASPAPSSLSRLPLEIQDEILRASPSPVGAAVLGCQLGIGSPFMWADKHMTVEREVCRGYLDEFTQLEARIVVNGECIGVSYKPKWKLKTARAAGEGHTSSGGEVN